MTTRKPSLAAAILVASAACHAALPAPAGEVPRFSIQEFQVEGNGLVSTDELKLRLSPFLGDQQTVDHLLAARAAITAAYQDAGRPLVTVGLPREFGTDGTIRFKVVEIPVRDVRVEGNSRLSEAQVRSRLPSLIENESPAMGRIARQLALANDNPALEVRIDFVPRDDLAADAKIQVKERPPVSFTVFADNSGTMETGRSRLGFSVTDADLLGYGDVAAVSYVMAPERSDRVHQVAASYSWPFPALGDALTVFGHYSDINSGRIGDAFNVAGQGSTLGIRYQHALVRTLGRRQTLDVGIESRHYRNIQDFSGTDLGNDLRSRPLVLAYGFASQQDKLQWSGNLTYARNLPGGERNNDTAYADARVGAQADWSVWRLNGRTALQLPGDFIGQVSGEAQYAYNPLISGEQFGVGGARSVRGFEERAVAGDRGWRLSGELATPNFGDWGRLALFADRGGESRLKPLPGESAGELIASWGLGWRYRRGSFSAVADWAQVTDGTGTTGKGHQKLHVQAALQF